MPLGSPRRIFAPSQRRRSALPALRLLLGGLLSMATVSAAAHWAAGLDFGHAALPPAGAATAPSLHLTASNAAVVDGQTLRLAGQVIRLEGVRTPSRADACAAGAANRDDCAAGAARRLADLVRGQTLACDLHGGDEAGRPYARCKVGSLDLNLALARWTQASARNADTYAAR